MCTITHTHKQKHFNIETNNTYPHSLTSGDLERSLYPLVRLGDLGIT